jgi:hypothetical protein
MYNCAEDKKHDRITVTGCDQNNKYKLSIDQDGVNPSARRDGIRVFFVCENCGKDSALTIVQHKGETYVEWE